ncbi:MAG: FAD-dependent oxidoreductase, partial [Bacteroidota bacterium]|nr:FAD-dependent oxidoreductase [Bacteroidota bacterium]
SAKLFATVLREIFLGAPDGADMLLPRAGLTPLLVDGALKVLRKEGAVLRLHASAEEILVRDGTVRGVRMKDGETMEADTVISAVPPWSLQRLAAASGLEDALGIDFNRFIPSEILSIHFRSRSDLGLPLMTGLLETRLHWIFDKGGEDGGGHRYSATISAVPEDLPRDAVSLRRMLVEELRLAAPDLQDEDVIEVIPIREKRATFVPMPGMETFRPSARTLIGGLYLAGDWTATGLPATIESAVRSGFSAAEAVVAR